MNGRLSIDDANEHERIYSHVTGGYLESVVIQAVSFHNKSLRALNRAHPGDWKRSRVNEKLDELCENSRVLASLLPVALRGLLPVLPFLGGFQACGPFGTFQPLAL